MNPDARSLRLDELREVISYDPESGAFTWKVNRGGTARAGTRAGTVNGHGYIQIRAGRRRIVSAHRLDRKSVV